MNETLSLCPVHGKGDAVMQSQSWLQAGVAVKEVEEATDAEKVEACYAILRGEHKGKPRPGLYYR